MAEDPLLAFKFHIELDQIIEGFFTECSGLNVEREVEKYKEGGVNNFEHQLPGRLKYTNITLKRGLTTSDELWKWFHENSDDQQKFFQVKRLNVAITQTDLTGTPVRQWTLKNAYPVKWKGPNLKSDSSQVAIETLEIAHHGIEQVML